MSLSLSPKGGLFLLFFFAAAAAAPVGKDPAPPKQEVRFKADFVRYDKKAKTLNARGHIQLISKDMKLTGDALSYQTETQAGTLLGSPTFRQKGTLIQSEKLHFNLKEKELVAEGSVTIVQEKRAIHKESEFKKELGELVTLTCDKLAYQYGTKKGELTGHIVAKTKGRKVFGEKASIDGEQELIHVIGGVKVEKEDGEWLQADEALINTKEDWLELKGSIRGLLQVEQEKIPKTKL